MAYEPMHIQYKSWLECGLEKVVLAVELEMFCG